MAVNEDDLILIEKYIQSKLTADEALAFKERSNTDIEFHQLYKQHQWILDGFEGIRFTRLESQLKQIGNSTSKSSPGRFRKYVFWAIAAAVLITLILVARSYLRHPQTFTPKEFALQYYEGPLQYTTRDAAHEVTMSSVSMAIAKKDWKQAIILLESIQDASLQEDKLYYLGHCHFNTGNVEAAISSFENLRSSRKYGEQAEWYLGLSLLYQGNVTESRQIFSSIIAASGKFYASRATEIMSKIPES